jgi:hypothetical protein
MKRCVCSSPPGQPAPGLRSKISNNILILLSVFGVVLRVALQHQLQRHLQRQLQNAERRCTSRPSSVLTGHVSSFLPY